MKLSLVTLAVLGAIAASAAQADTFAFDPNGTGSTAINNGALIDQAPGNALSVNGNQAVKNFLAKSGSTSLTTYYQSNLSGIQAADTSNLFSNGTGGKFFTFTAGFGEKVTSAESNGSATFAFDAANPVNYFNMYATSSIANNLTGAGFASGSLILTGHVISIPSSSFTVSTAITTPVNLDQSPNGNDWGTQKTVSGTGSSDITFQIDSANDLYFPDLIDGTEITLSFLNTSLVDPFKQIDPSKCFNTESSTCTAGGVTGNLGATNGSLGADGGPDFQFQADANQSVIRTVPEPATIALLGLGLLAIGVGSSRRKAS